MNNIIWKYKSDLLDEEVYTRIENERGIEIPSEIKELISEANGATPSKYKFVVGDKERVLGSILSFNENEPDSDSVFTALMVVKDANLLPFGIDPFGNYICYNLSTQNVDFLDHENGNVSSTEKNLKEFLKSLY